MIIELEDKNGKHNSSGNPAEAARSSPNAQYQQVIGISTNPIR
jgi:hypothetical protein